VELRFAQAQRLDQRVRCALAADAAGWILSQFAWWGGAWNAPSKKRTAHR